MNSTINFSSFLELLLVSENNFESYELIPCVQRSNTPDHQEDYLKPRRVSRDHELDTWHGE